MATNEKIYIESSDISNIAASLVTKGNAIKEEFTNNCYPTLKMCGSSLEITGLDTTSFFDSFTQIYEKINIRCNELSNFLTKTIIPSYDEMSNSVKNNFDSNFADKLASTLGISAPISSSVAKDGANIIDNKDMNDKVVPKTAKLSSTVENKDIEEFNDNSEVLSEPSENILEEVPVEIEDTIQETPEIIDEASNASDLSGNASSLSKGFKIGAGIAGVGLAAGAAGIVTHKVFEEKEEEQERKKKLEEIANKNNLSSVNAEPHNSFINNSF